MGKIFTQIINRFDGGISEDKRANIANKFSITKHFDAFTYPHKLIPYYATEAKEDKTIFISSFQYDPTQDYLWGLGTKAGGTNTGVYYYNLANQSNNWTTPASNTMDYDYVPGCFLFYKDYVYFFRDTYLCRKVTNAGTALDPNYQAVSCATVAQGVVHPNDDCAYFFAENVVYRLNNTSWEGAVLTLPTNLKIMSACAYGNYLAIGCVTKGTSDAQTIVYLWDRDSSLVTLSERIDFGRGILLHLVSLGGVLTAVINLFLGYNLSLKKGKIVIKQYNGSSAVLVNEVTADNLLVNLNDLPRTNFVKNNKLYFPMSVPLDGDTRNGIWCVDKNGKINLDFIEFEVDSATSKTYQGIYQLGEQWWIAHSADGSVNRTVTSYAYSVSNPSIYQTLKFGSSDSKYKLLLAGVMTEPLPSGGQITLKYKKDSETTWTTIYIDGTDNSLYHEAINIESSEANLPQYQEIEFLVESIGGAVITGLMFKYEEIDDGLMT